MVLETENIALPPPDKLITLKEIQAPVSAELKIFKEHFQKHIHSDVFLLNQIIKYLLRMKGKEMRPLLVLLSAKLSGGITDRTYIAGTMIELLHTATLIHDDVVDNADQRRGFLSINKIWKNKASVLLGDYLLSKGLLVAVNSDEFELLKILSEAVRQMSEGELRQLKASGMQKMTEEKYYQIISEKTGSLLVACCVCGAVSSGASEEVKERMHKIGYHIGLAFQIRDDLLDYSLNNTGKPRANDIIERKFTLPFIVALKNSTALERKKMQWIFRKKRKTKEDIHNIIAFAKSRNGIAYTQKKMEEHAGKALKYLNEFEDSEIRTHFSEFIRFVIYRKK